MLDVTPPIPLPGHKVLTGKWCIERHSGSGYGWYLVGSRRNFNFHTKIIYVKAILFCFSSSIFGFTAIILFSSKLVGR